MNSSTPDGAERDPGWSDHARLLAGAAICGALAVAVLPFDPPILGMCNVDPQSAALGFWDWMDRIAPRVVPTLAAVLGVVLLFRGRDSARLRRGGFALLAAFVVTLVVVSAVKTLTGRDRPLADPVHGVKLWSPLTLKDDRSFPSGHVAASTAICAALWLSMRRRPLRNVVWVFPPTMMYSRLCLAVHWPSDVLGGAAFGLASAAGVAWVARFVRVDHLLGWFGKDGSPRARLLLVAFVWLGITRIWLELPLGRDPVSGEVVPGFVTQPHRARVLLEPILGPPLHLAIEDAGSLLRPAIAWTAAALLVLGFFALRARRLVPVVLVLLLPVLWAAIFLKDWNPPDRFVVEDRKGAFVDWHLHGDDPFDGAIDAESLNWRQLARGVGCAVMTPHSIDTGDGEPAGIACGLHGTEWSGRLPKKGGRWTLPHVLVIGGLPAVRHANAQVAPLDAVGAAGRGDALAIVAHDWRSRATIPDCPTFEKYVEAGVHGFEVGNRRRETNPAALARLRELDRKCREKGLLRFSFSDDHGIPAGSPCVTFLEGVSESELRAQGGGAAILAKLRSPDHGGINVIPLLFCPGDPTLFPPRWLAPPVIAFEYFRSLRFSQRASWFVFVALASLWVFRPRSAQPSPAPSVRSS